jgi:hypothetical protein
MYEQFGEIEVARQAACDYAIKHGTTVTVTHDTVGHVYKIIPYGSVYVRGEYPVESFDKRGKHPYAA